MTILKNVDFNTLANQSQCHQYTLFSNSQEHEVNRRFLKFAHEQIKRMSHTKIPSKFPSVRGQKMKANLPSVLLLDQCKSGILNAFRLEDLTPSGVLMRNPVRLDQQALEASATVANCCMNRERDLYGSNGYQKELGLEPLAILAAAANQSGVARWLDLCCGSGKALIQAAELTESQSLSIEIVGVDLIDMFLPHDHNNLRLTASSWFRWRPNTKFDLITCVHGLHYIGDKLQAITSALSWLNDSGTFIANLDLASIHIDDASAQDQKQLSKALQSARIEYDAQKKRLRCDGPRELAFPFTYAGADDQAGPNYTGQPAVNSHYVL